MAETPDLKPQVVGLVHKQLNFFATFQDFFNVVDHYVFHLIHLSNTHPFKLRKVVAATLKPASDKAYSAA